MTGATIVLDCHQKNLIIQKNGSSFFSEGFVSDFGEKFGSDAEELCYLFLGEGINQSGIDLTKFSISFFGCKAHVV